MVIILQKLLKYLIPSYNSTISPFTLAAVCLLYLIHILLPAQVQPEDVKAVVFSTVDYFRYNFYIPCIPSVGIAHTNEQHKQAVCTSV